MKHILAGLAVLTLSACSGADPLIRDLAPNIDPEKMTAVGDGSSICPTEHVITDINSYLNNSPADMEDYALWHTTNGKRKFVKTTESGLQYQVVKKGASNGPSPVGSQIIKVNYHGFFPNGEIFDSSYERGEPIEFPANGVIQGWIEGLGMMKPCDAWTLYIPGKLAYGPRGRPGIPPNATLGFHVQLLEVK